MSVSIKYVVVTPVRDEEAYLEKTIEALASQTIRPDRWQIVNDGSTDRTGAIADAAARSYPWIRVVHRSNRGFRKAGGGVVEAFYDGYAGVDGQEWDFIAKLDGDLSFENDYFERCLQKFKENPKLGVGGGVILNLIEGSLVPEKHPLFHVRGATKIYRRACWEAIGGLIQAPGWDTLDEVKANMMGFETRAFLDLQVVHYRCTGGADGSWKNSVKNGMANYISGYHPLFMLVKCLKRMAARPYVFHAAGLLYGFISGYAKRVPQVDDPQLIAYIRREQVKKLLLRPSIWN
jgi:glycosyltransferase involved in cell wall biosynthesis